MELCGWVRSARRTAHADAAGGTSGVEGALPRCLADVVDHDVRPAIGDLLDAGHDVVGVVAERGVGSQLARARELFGARRGDDHLRAQRLGDRQGRRGNSAADAPDEHPFARLEAGLRHEHPVRGLEHEREGCRRLEAEAFRD